MTSSAIVKTGMRNNAIKGNFNGGIVPYGFRWKDGRITIDEHEAEAVKIMFRRAAQREEPYYICQELRHKGFTTRRGGGFNARTLKRILTNKKYIGIYEFDDVSVENLFPVIVSKELFMAVQKTKRYRGGRNGKKEKTT